RSWRLIVIPNKRFWRREGSGRAARCVAFLATQLSRVWLASLSNCTTTCPLRSMHVTLPRLLYSTLMLKETFEQGQALTDSTLDRLLPPETQHPVSFHKAMRHSVFAVATPVLPFLCIDVGSM